MADERSIFLEALEKRSPHERSTYLDAACAGDTALRARVGGAGLDRDAGAGEGPCPPVRDGHRAGPATCRSARVARTACQALTVLASTSTPAIVPVVVIIALFRRTNLRIRYVRDGGHASTG